MGLHHSTGFAGKQSTSPPAKQQHQRSPSAGTASTVPRLLRISSKETSSRSSSITSQHDVLTIKHVAFVSSSKQRSKSGKASSGKSHIKTPDKLISSLDKTVHKLVSRHSGSAITGGGGGGTSCTEGANVLHKSIFGKSDDQSGLANGANGKQGLATPKLTKLTKTEQRGREASAITSSDVFIYPPNYRDMSECHKCARDNKICDCIVIEPPKINGQRVERDGESEPKLLDYCPTIGHCDPLALGANNNHSRDHDAQVKNIDVRGGISTPKVRQEGNLNVNGVEKLLAPGRAQQFPGPELQFDPVYCLNHEQQQQQQQRDSNNINIASAQPTTIDQNNNQAHWPSPEFMSTQSSQNFARCTPRTSNDLLPNKSINESAIRLGKLKNDHSLSPTVSTTTTTTTTTKCCADKRSETPQNANSLSGLSLMAPMVHDATSSQIPIRRNLSSIDENDATERRQDDACAIESHSYTDGHRCLRSRALTVPFPVRVPLSIETQPTTSATCWSNTADSIVTTTRTTPTSVVFDYKGAQTKASGQQPISGETKTFESVNGQFRLNYQNTNTSLPTEVHTTESSVPLNKQLCYETASGDCGDLVESAITTTTNCQANEISNTQANSRHTASMRRKFLQSKLNKKLIVRDDELVEEGQKRWSLVPFDQFYSDNAVAIAPEIDQCPGNGDVSESESQLSGYSPILSSARTYIENMNPELRSSTIINSSHSRQLCVDESVNCLTMAIGEICPKQQILPEVRLIEHTNPTAEATPIEFNNATNDIIVQTSSVGTVVTSRAITIPISCANGLDKSLGPADARRDLDTPKQSIFDGASKDEILEYLEDARERVPDILIAADEVMVLSESELIVVNQLELESAATQMTTIGDPNGVMQEPPDVATIPLARMMEPGDFSVSTRNATGDAGELNSVELAAKLDQDDHHELLFKPGIDPSLRLMGTGESLNGSTKGDYDSPPCSASLDIGDNAGGEFYGCQMSQTIDEGDDHYRELCNLRAAKQDALDSLDQQSLDSKSPDNDELQLINLAKLSTQETSSSQSNQSGEGSSPISGDLNNYCTPPPKSSSVDSRERQHNSSHFRRHHDIFSAQRRKSTSESCDLKAKEAINDLQTMFLQKRYANRRSISSSSSSSSPPSFASPSTNTSQTSGNCSAASNFYASTSLSCSSPFIALNQLTSLNNCSVFSASGRSGCAGNTSKQIHPPNSTGVSGDQTINNNGRLDLTNSSLLTNFLGKKGATSNEDDDNQLDLTISNRNHNQESLAHFQQSTKTMSSNMNAGNRRQNMTESIGELNNCKLSNNNNNNNNNNVVGLSKSESDASNRLSVIEEIQHQHDDSKLSNFANNHQYMSKNDTINAPPVQAIPKTTIVTPGVVTKFNQAPKLAAPSPCNLISRPLHSHYATINRLNSYLMNRSNESNVEFQCRDCDQLINVDHARMINKTNEIKLLRENDINLESIRDKPMTLDQLERAYIVAMNGLPLCGSCEKRRNERKEIISEFVETELKYGCDLKIIHDEFYRPMQIAGLLNKDQINGIFLSLENLLMAHCRFAERLGAAISEATMIGDTEYNTINIGKLFVESADMLHTFESYCIRQGSAACLLARLTKEKELLRIFLRVSQMENTLLRRMNLAAFLMVPVQRVTKYPLLLNRLYKVTPYYHKDREALRDAQLKVELHLEHINQETSGITATNKIWRRISNLSSAPNLSAASSRRGMINAEDIGYIKLRKAAMDLLKWDRDEIQFIHSGKIDFALLNEYLTKQKTRPLRYMTAHSLLIVLGKPNWKYRPDLIKPNLWHNNDHKLMGPTPGGTGIKEAALLLLREKNGRFIPCREPLFLSNCVLSTDCSQFNCENSICGQQNHQLSANKSSTSNNNNNNNNHHHHHHHQSSSTTITTSERRSLPGLTSASKIHPNSQSSNGKDSSANSSCNSSFEFRAASAGSRQQMVAENFKIATTKSLSSKPNSNLSLVESEVATASSSGQMDSVSMLSLKSLPENQFGSCGGGAGVTSQTDGVGGGIAYSVVPPPPPPPPPLPIQAPRSYSLASALLRTSITNLSSNSSLNKSSSSTSASSNSTILNQLMTKMNNHYHHSSSSSKHQGTSEPKTVATPRSSCDDSADLASRMLNATANSIVDRKSTNNNNNNNNGLIMDNNCTQSHGDLSNRLPIEVSGGGGGCTADSDSGDANKMSGFSSCIVNYQQPIATMPTIAPTSGTIAQLTNKKLATMGSSTGSGGGGGGVALIDSNNTNHSYYNHHLFQNHHQPYGAYEESFEIHDRISKESLLLRAETQLKTRYWLQILRYHAKDLGPWRTRRNGLANIMMMRQD